MFIHVHVCVCIQCTMCTCICTMFQAVDQMMKLYEMFIKRDCTALEINPLATDSQSRSMQDNEHITL